VSLISSSVWFAEVIRGKTDTLTRQNGQDMEPANQSPIPSSSRASMTGITDNMTAKAKLKADIEYLKEKLRKLELVDVYKKKWTVAELTQSVEAWTNTGQNAANELYSRLLQDYPDLTRETLAKSFSHHCQLAHIDNLNAALDNVFCTEIEIDD